MLATAGQPFASVAARRLGLRTSRRRRQHQTTGFTFTVNPALPAGLPLDPAHRGDRRDRRGRRSRRNRLHHHREQFIGAGAALPTPYPGRSGASPVAVDFGGGGAVRHRGGAAMALPAPAPVAGGVATGFGVSPGPAGRAGPGPLQRPGFGHPHRGPGRAPPSPSPSPPPAGSANAPFTLLVSAAVPAAPERPHLPRRPNPLVLTRDALHAGPRHPVTRYHDLVYTVSPALPAGPGLGSAHRRHFRNRPVRGRPASLHRHRQQRRRQQPRPRCQPHGHLTRPIPGRSPC